MKIVFNEVSVKGVRRWTDESGKKRQETRKFFQTINPFNKNADGTVKTKEEILIEITKQRDLWLSEKAKGGAA